MSLIKMREEVLFEKNDNILHQKQRKNVSRNREIRDVCWIVRMSHWHVTIRDWFNFKFFFNQKKKKNKKKKKKKKNR